VVWCSPPTAF